MGAGYIQGAVGVGGSETFLVMYCGGGVEIKSPWGRGVKRGGGHIFHQIFGGVRCVPLVFAFI